MKKVQQLFQSEDGNTSQREVILNHIEKILTTMDELKDPNKTILGEKRSRSPLFYQELMEQHTVPEIGSSLDTVVEDLVELMEGHPYHTHNFVTNVLPMASVPGVLGSLTNSLLNGNNLWDVYGPSRRQSVK